MLSTIFPFDSLQLEASVNSTTRENWNSAADTDKANRLHASTTTLASAATSTPNPVANQTQKSIKELLYNGTGFYIEDEGESGLNDLQTLLLACIATLVPLILSLFTAFGIRILWTKYKLHKENAQYDGIDHDGTTESISKPLHSHLLIDKQCHDSNLEIGTEELEVCDGSISNSQSKSNHSNTNGSIITMTLKNNHLIVETEERNDIKEDSRETTMKYSPSARNGVFVVEVQQGVKRSPTSGPTNGTSLVSVSDQCALIHNPPDKSNDKNSLNKLDTTLASDDTSSGTTAISTLPAKTGLSQSNTSINSNKNQSYCYTNQQGYDNGGFGYSIYNGYVNDEPLKALPTDDNRPKIMSAVYKTPAKKEIALTDVESVSLRINNVDDDIQEEQTRLGNATTEKNISVTSQEEAEIKNS